MFLYICKSTFIYSNYMSRWCNYRYVWYISLAVHVRNVICGMVYESFSMGITCCVFVYVDCETGSNMALQSSFLGWLSIILSGTLWFHSHRTKAVFDVSYCLFDHHISSFIIPKLYLLTCVP